MTDWPILSAVTFLPLVGVALLLLTREDSPYGRRNILNVSLLTTLFTFVLSLFVWIGFDYSNPGFQMIEHHEWLGTGIAYIWRGEIVAELSYANELETPEQIKATSAKILPELARQIGDHLPGDVNPLPAVRLLPQERLVPMGIAYTHRDALGVTGLGAGATGYYQDGDQRYRVVSLARADEDSAKDVLGTLKKLPGSKVQKDLGFDAVAFSTREAEGSPQAEWLAGRAGSNVIIVGDEPLKLKAGADSKATARLPADKRLNLLKAALSPKSPGSANANAK